MNWYTNLRVKQLKRRIDTLEDEAKTNSNAYVVLERKCQAYRDQANRLASENASVRSRMTDALAARETADAKAEAALTEARAARLLLEREREMSRERLLEKDEVQQANKRALQEIADLKERLAGSRVGMAVYPPYERRPRATADAIADETRAKRYYDGLGDQ